MSSRRGRPRSGLLTRWLWAGLAGGTLVLTAASARVAWGQDSAGTRGVSPTDPAEIWRRDCASCHGSDGRGTRRGPSLVGDGAAAVDYWLSTGRMPLVDEPARDEHTRQLQPLPGVQQFDADARPHRHQPAYSARVIDALVAYVVDLTGGGGPSIPDLDVERGSVANGGDLFRLQCAACHAWAGDGGALLHREAPPLHAATSIQVAEAIRTGPGTMPVFGPAALSDRELEDVVAYVRYLDDPRDRGGWAIWHLGPVAEGGVAWLVAMTALLLAVRWMGEST